MRRPALAYSLIFLIGAGLAAIDLGRAVDGRVGAAWREADVAAVARNFHREGMDIRYPRIDWRGSGPGFAEMELPFLPWLMAASYRVTGVHEVQGRVIVYAISLLTLLAFFALARRLLAPEEAAAASLFFAISPLIVQLSTALQPEPLMLCGVVLGVYAFIRWQDTGGWAWYATSLVAIAFALLAKATAAHIGLLLLFLLLRQRGAAMWRDWRVWAFGAATVLPAALWYVHAHGLWLDYGNSLGVSNESHWIGADFFTNPAFIRGIARMELAYVWTPAGVLVAAYGVVTGWGRRDAVPVGLAWLAAVGLFYVLASRTTGDSWALHYHVLSVPPAALLFGAGAGAGVRLVWRQPDAIPRSGRARLIALAVVAAALAAWALELRQVVLALRPRHWQAHYACARAFAALLPPDALILASGGPCVDETGRAVAYNASYMFYWTDRKGFNICQQEQSVEHVRELSARGARYFIAEKSATDRVPGFEADLRQAFSVAAECPRAVLFDLRTPAGGEPTSPPAARSR